MNEQEAFVVADQALCDVVDQIRDDQWAMPIPEWFQRGWAKGDLDLRTIINYHAYDDAWVPDVLAGKTKEQVGDRFDGDLLGADPKGSFRALARSAIEAVRALDDPEREVHLSYGDFPARQYLQHITSFRGFRVFDLSQLIGAGTTMPEPLVQGLFDVVVPHIEQWRLIGVFGPAIEPPTGADAQARLLCLAGRQPQPPLR